MLSTSAVGADAHLRPACRFRARPAIWTGCRNVSCHDMHEEEHLHLPVMPERFRAALREARHALKVTTSAPPPPP